MCLDWLFGKEEEEEVLKGVKTFPFKIEKVLGRAVLYSLSLGTMQAALGFSLFVCFCFHHEASQL